MPPGSAPRAARRPENGNFHPKSSLEPSSRALREIQPGDADPATLVFGLTGEALANRVRAAAKAAGLGDGFSGHSGRIGMARRMVAAGAPNAAVQRQGRCRHGDMVARYTGVGRGGRGSALVAELTKSKAGGPSENDMTDNPQPVCDCLEPCACYA